MLGKVVVSMFIICIGGPEVIRLIDVGTLNLIESQKKVIIEVIESPKESKHPAIEQYEFFRDISADLARDRAAKLEQEEIAKSRRNNYRTDNLRSKPNNYAIYSTPNKEKVIR